MLVRSNIKYVSTRELKLYTYTHKNSTTLLSYCNLAEIEQGNGNEGIGNEERRAELIRVNRAATESLSQRHGETSQARATSMGRSAG